MAVDRMQLSNGFSIKLYIFSQGDGNSITTTSQTLYRCGNFKPDIQNNQRLPKNDKFQKIHSRVFALSGCNNFVRSGVLEYLFWD